MLEVRNPEVREHVASSLPDRRHRHRLLAGVFVLFALWMISPIFTSSYVEAYVARLQSMAILNHHGLLAMDDQAYPINSELLYVTRLGMVWLLQGAMVVLHNTSLWVLRLVTMASFVLLVASSVIFARRWAQVPAWAVLACAVLTPGVLEPSFFFADNLVSAALTTFALALVRERISFPRWFAIGAIVGCAMLIRLDAVLIVPAVLAVLWLASRAYRRMGLACLYAAAGAMVIFAISYAVTSVSLLTAFHVGQLFSRINNNPAIYQTGLAKTRELIFFGFFGLVTLPLLAIGAWENFKLRPRRWNVVMTLLPVLFYAAVIPHANEIRDFCIMGAPFVLLQAGTGLRRLLASAEGPAGARRWGALLVFAAFALVFIAPPYLSMRDGPRALTGRLYTPIFWRQWQGRTLGMIDQIHGLVNGVEPGQSMLVISSQFEPDRYLHLRLLQEGFQLDRAAGAGGDCQSIETFRKHGRVVTTIRTENPYGIFTGATMGNYLEALQIVDSLQCLRGVHFDRSYFFSIGQQGELYWPALGAAEVRIPARFPLPILHTASYGFFGSTPLSPADVERLDAAARQSLATLATASPLTYADFHSRVGHRYWSPRE